MTDDQIPNIAKREAEEMQSLLRAAIEEYERDNAGEAATRFLALAEQGCEESLQYLALIYESGDGVERNDIKAAEFRRKYAAKIESSAAAGSVASRLKFAYMLQFGDCVKMDALRAYRLFVQLADQGVPEAQFHLSNIYAHGGCDQARNESLEMRWLSAAANSGWPEAMYRVALYTLREPDSIGEAKAHALAMMTRAAEAGSWQAREFLSSSDPGHT